jgi:cyclic pyranopterin phosphate synthase
MQGGNERGLDGARMIDVGAKPVQRRVAKAAGRIALAPGTVRLIAEQGIEKGDVLTVAQVAGIQAAKRTAELVPMCHPLPLDAVDVQLRLAADGVEVASEVHCIGRTGVEMEALVAVSAALLTVYDMCKAVDKQMRIGGIVLTEKAKSDVIHG